MAYSKETFQKLAKIAKLGGKFIEKYGNSNCKIIISFNQKGQIAATMVEDVVSAVKNVDAGVIPSVEFKSLPDVTEVNKNDGK